jgi:hypothetical protein
MTRKVQSKVSHFFLSYTGGPLTESLSIKIPQPEYFILLESEAPRAPARGFLIRMAELSVAFSPPSLRLRRALLAIHPHPSGRGFLAKENKK